MKLCGTNKTQQNNKTREGTTLLDQESFETINASIYHAIINNDV